MSGDLAVEVRGLGKCYQRVAQFSHHDGVGDFLRSKFRRLGGHDPGQGRIEDFWALRDASFSIRQGENVGVIGLNGAGKSTLLKLLSRVTEPSTGSATIHGRVGALLEVGTGFHPELTGRENVFMYGSILGMTRKEVARKYEDIVDFSEVRDFIEMPVKRYSSGMYVRLAFAVAAHLDPEILFLDEVLAVGDLAFQRKCLDHAKNLQEKDATILFVSHNMFTIKAMCERVIYVKKGRIEYDGPIDGGIALYEQDCRLTSAGGLWGNPETWPIHVTESQTLGADGAARAVFDMGESLALRFRYRANEKLECPNFIVTLVRSDGVVCSSYSTEVDGHDTSSIHGEGVVELRLPPIKLVAEMYTINVAVRKKGFQDLMCNQTVATMHVRHDLLNSHFGVFHEKGEWAFV